MCTLYSDVLIILDRYFFCLNVDFLQVITKMYLHSNKKISFYISVINKGMNSVYNRYHVVIIS